MPPEARYPRPHGAARALSFEASIIFTPGTPTEAKTVDEIAATAERAGLDFVILTDHGAPNLPSLDSQGKIGRVLVLAGTEISSSRGHLVALGFDPPSRPFSQTADLAVREVRSLWGFYRRRPPLLQNALVLGRVDGIRRDRDHERRHRPPARLGRVAPFFPRSSSSRRWRCWRSWTRRPRRSGMGPLAEPSRADLRLLRRRRPPIFRNRAECPEYPRAVGFPRARRLRRRVPGNPRRLPARTVLQRRRSRGRPTGFRFRREGGNGSPTVLHVQTPYSFAHETRLLHRAQSWPGPRGRTSSTKPATRAPTGSKSTSGNGRRSGPTFPGFAAIPSSFERTSHDVDLALPPKVRRAVQDSGTAASSSSAT